MRSLLVFFRRFSKRKKIQLAVAGSLLVVAIVAVIVFKYFNIFAAGNEISNTATIYYQDAAGNNYSVNSNTVVTIVENPIIRITLNLQGRTNHSTNNGKISIYNPGTSNLVFEASNIVIDSTGQGQITVTNLVAGQNYDYKFKVPEHLSTLVANTAYQNDLGLAFGIQKGGDLNNDNMVNSLDFAVLSGHWSTSDPISDINADGNVNTIDFSILSSNWFVTGQ